MITLSQILKLYKREDIQNAIIENAQDKEIAIKFGDSGFGKRPDILKYPNDVLELAKQGATSFHASEELWRNPLQLDPIMKKMDVEELRIGWDLVLDIDCPIWKLAKITTWLMIKSLSELGVKSISLKFSGNKGFHIGVPFEAFPKEVNGVLTSSLFPEAPRSIATYLLDYISSNHIKISGDNEVSFGNKFKASFSRLGTEGNGVLTISGGLATFPKDGQNMDELFEKADQALLEAKRSGKNRIYLVGSENSSEISKS